MIPERKAEMGVFETERRFILEEDATVLGKRKRRRWLTSQCRIYIYNTTFQKKHVGNVSQMLPLIIINYFIILSICIFIRLLMHPLVCVCVCVNIPKTKQWLWNRKVPTLLLTYGFILVQRSRGRMNARRKTRISAGRWESLHNTCRLTPPPLSQRLSIATPPPTTTTRWLFYLV